MRACVAATRVFVSKQATEYFVHFSVCELYFTLKQYKKQLQWISLTADETQLKKDGMDRGVRRPFLELSMEMEIRKRDSDTWTLE